MITRRVKKVGKVYYPQAMFKLFWFIPTGWWRNYCDFHYDIVDGKYLDDVFFKTEKEANEYIIY